MYLGKWNTNNCCFCCCTNLLFNSEHGNKVLTTQPRLCYKFKLDILCTYNSPYENEWGNTNFILLFQTFVTRAREFQLDISKVDISRINEKLRQTIYPFQKEGIQYVLNYMTQVNNLFSVMKKCTKILFIRINENTKRVLC